MRSRSLVSSLRVCSSSLGARGNWLAGGIACALNGRPAGQQFFSRFMPVLKRGDEGRGADFLAFFHGLQTARQDCGCHGVGREH